MNCSEYNQYSVLCQQCTVSSTSPCKLNIPGYIEESIPIIEDNRSEKVKQVRIIRTSERGSDIVFKYEGSDMEHILYNADDNCEHEIVGGDNCSGIKCRKCGGWYCA